MDVQFIFFKGILVLQGLICYKIKSIYLSFALRNYHDEYTRSNLITEVTHCRAGTVFG